MTQTDLAHSRDVLRTKQAELAKMRGLESIAIERSADELEEADYRTASELAIAGLNRERPFDAAWRQRCSGSRTVVSERACIAVVKLANGAWPQRRGRRSASRVRRRLIGVKRGSLKASIRHSSTRPSRGQAVMQ